MADLLQEGVALHAVEETSLSRKLTVDGMTRAYPVYKIKLDHLYYNDQNDRIATWISQYRTQHDGRAPDLEDRDAYNQVIEQFIVESNPDALRKTRTNIKLVGQREPGVVLNDGRIIDGNRRFTCLRQLAGEDPRSGWFEAVILDRSMEHSAKQIKLLELSIQHGEESKVDYDPIDRLVGVYNDIVKTGLLSPEEYALSTLSDKDCSTCLDSMEPRQVGSSNRLPLLSLPVSMQTLSFFVPLMYESPYNSCSNLSGSC